MTTFVTDKTVSKEETNLWLQNNFGMNLESLMPKSMMEATHIIKKTIKK